MEPDPISAPEAAGGLPALAQRLIGHNRRRPELYNRLSGPTSDHTRRVHEADSCKVGLVHNLLQEIES
jgi:hypothetical protein